jgi:RHS repeat-associated protein
VQSGTGAPALILPNIKAPKNGYAYVYVSNVSDEMVYFDNLQVTNNRGRIIEEDHYYAFGLKIAGISSKKLGDFNEGVLDNKNFYNDKELIDDADLNWYDYGFRNYDAQIGRFTQLDPLTDQYPELTPYQYAGNEPIANVDVDGLEPWSVLPGVTVTATKSASKSVSLVSAFKTVMHAIPGTLGALSTLIPENKTGEAIVGGVVGVGEASRDAVVGTYNMVRHPINTIAGMAEMSTVQGQVNAAVSVASNYVQSSSQFGERFTNARFISYAVTSIGIAVAGPKVLKGVAGTGLKTAAKGVGRLKIPVYRVYGGGASMYGKSYSLTNPKYVPFYRNFAGLPNVNSGQYLLKGSIPLKDIKVGRWFAAPLDGNTGGLPFELYQNYNQLNHPANVIVKKPF